MLPLQMIHRNVAERDIYLIHIEKEIEIRRKKLLEKQQKIHHITTQNHFLEKVKQDYSNYHSIILKQKQEQIRALELLNQYIEDLSVSGKLSKHNIKDSVYEQKKILSEIKKIKKSLDEITSTFSSTFSSTF